MTSPLIGISTFICTTTLDLAQLLVECAGSLDLHVDLDSSLDLGGRLNTGTGTCRTFVFANLGSS